MNKFLRQVTFVFSAGCFGGIANGLIVWLFGTLGVSGALGVRIAPPLTPQFIYQRIVWGGIWGFMFLLPFLRKSYFMRGLLYSLGPTLIQLFIVFPVKLHSGIMGMDVGYLTPVFVLFYNAIWGVYTGLWLKWVSMNESPE
jgi:hypothetical protein